MVDGSGGEGRKFVWLLFMKEWEFLDENFTVDAIKHF